MNEWAQELFDRIAPNANSATSRGWQVTMPHSPDTVAFFCLSYAVKHGIPLTEHDLEMTRRAVEIGWGISFRKVGPQVLSDVEASLGLVAA